MQFNKIAMLYSMVTRRYNSLKMQKPVCQLPGQSFHFPTPQPAPDQEMCIIREEGESASLCKSATEYFLRLLSNGRLYNKSKSQHLNYIYFIVKISVLWYI